MPATSSLTVARLIVNGAALFHGDHWSLQRRCVYVINPPSTGAMAKIDNSLATSPTGYVSFPTYLELRAYLEQSMDNEPLSTNMTQPPQPLPSRPPLPFPPHTHTHTHTHRPDRIQVLLCREGREDTAISVARSRIQTLFRTFSSRFADWSHPVRKSPWRRMDRSTTIRTSGGYGFVSFPTNLRRGASTVG